MRKSLKNHKGIKYTYDEKLNFHKGKEECEITKIIYADDIIIVSQSEEEVKKSLENLDNITKNCGMRISYKKTMILVIDEPENKRIGKKHVMINGNKVYYVNDVTHLGRRIDNGCSKIKRHKENVVNRISKTFMKYLFLVWNNKYVDLELS